MRSVRLTLTLAALGSLCALASDDPLPIGQALSRDYVNEHLRMTELRPEGNPDHAFQMLLPPGWVQDAPDGLGEPVASDRFRPLLAIRDADEGRGPVLFHVQALSLTRDLRAAHVWEQHARSLGQQPLARRELSPWFVDSLMAQRIAGEDMRVRQAVLLSGPRAFILSGVAPAARYPDFADRFGVMVASFQLLDLPEHPGVEPWPSARLGDGVSFRHPASWRLREIGVEGGTVVRLGWHHDDGRLVSQISLEREARRLEDEQAFGLMLRLLREGGLALSEDFDTIQFELSESPLAVRAGRVYEASQADAARAWTLRLLLFDLADESLRVWQLQPRREADFPGWAASTRALELMLSTMVVDHH